MPSYSYTILFNRMSESYQRLHRAVVSPSAGTAALLRELSAAGTDVNSIDQSGFSCLMVAVKNGKTERALVLVDHGASLTQVNAAGWTAFHFAASCDDLSVLKSMARSAGCEDLDMFMDDLLGRLTRGGKLPKDVATGACRSWLEKAEACADADALRRYIGASGGSDQSISNAALPAQPTSTASLQEKLRGGGSRHELGASRATRRGVPFLVMAGVVGLAFVVGVTVATRVATPADAPLPPGLSLLSRARRDDHPTVAPQAATPRVATHLPRWLREMARWLRKTAVRVRSVAGRRRTKDRKPSG